MGGGGGRGGWGVDGVVLSTFWNTNILRDWQRSLLGYYNHFYVSSFIRIQQEQHPVVICYTIKTPV